MAAYKRISVCLLVSAFFAYKRCQAEGVNVCGDSQQIPCDNSECILRDFWCDGVRNCLDGSDERYCQTKWWFDPVPDNHCNPAKHFVCKDGGCYPAVARCDGINDCFDDSDEEQCGTISGESSSVTPHLEEERSTLLPLLNASTPDERAVDLISSSGASLLRITPTTATRSAPSYITKSATSSVRHSTFAAQPIDFRGSTTSTTPDYYSRKNAPESVDPNAAVYYPAGYYDRNQQYPHPQRHYAGSDIELGQHFPAYGPSYTQRSSIVTPSPWHWHTQRPFAVTPSTWIYSTLATHRPFVVTPSPPSTRTGDASNEYLSTSTSTTTSTVPPVTFQTLTASTPNYDGVKNEYGKLFLHHLREKQDLSLQHAKEEHDLRMQHRKEEHDLRMQHRKEEHNLRMQHKAQVHERQQEEHDLSMHHKKQQYEHERREYELFLQYRKEHELLMQRRREQHELMMQHKKEKELLLLRKRKK